MSSLNKVMLIGNLGADPEIKTLNSGSQIANFTIATSEKWRDKSSGERKEKTEWHRIVSFNEGLNGVIEQYLRKGSKVYIEGKLQTRKWQDNDGKDRYSTEIVMDAFNGKLVMLSSRDDGGSRGGEDEFGRRETSSRGSRQSNNRSSGYRGNDDMNDDIPFSPEFRG